MIEDPVDAEPVHNEDFILKCDIIDGHPTEILEYKWTKTPQSIVSTTEFLEFKPLDYTEDYGEYQCEVRNTPGWSVENQLYTLDITGSCSWMLYIKLCIAHLFIREISIDCSLIH